jgi:NAD(P) transhydrogenase subunit beta
MEQANAEFTTTDVVLVLGANDVVNPRQKPIPASPIYGMPVLDVEEAKMVIVNKRSMKPGYAASKTTYSSAQNLHVVRRCKKVLQDLVSEIKNV